MYLFLNHGCTCKQDNFFASINVNNGTVHVLISGTNHMFLVWLLVKTAYCIWFKPIWSPGKCLHKSQNLLQWAFLWVCINPHEKLTKSKMFFVRYLWWKCRKYALLCIPHTTSEATQKNMGKKITWIYQNVWYSENRAQHNKTVSIFLGIVYIITHERAKQDKIFWVIWMLSGNQTVTDS